MSIDSQTGVDHDRVDYRTKHDRAFERGEISSQQRDQNNYDDQSRREMRAFQAEQKRKEEASKFSPTWEGEGIRRVTEYFRRYKECSIAKDQQEYLNQYTKEEIISIDNAGLTDVNKGYDLVVETMKKYIDKKGPKYEDLQEARAQEAEKFKNKPKEEENANKPQAKNDTENKPPQPNISENVRNAERARDQNIAAGPEEGESQEDFQKRVNRVRVTQADGSSKTMTLDEYRAQESGSSKPEEPPKFTPTEDGNIVATETEWKDAWKKHVSKNKIPQQQKEDYSDPSPLLADKIGALPAQSKQRRFHENFYLTLAGRGTNTGFGFDNMTRESYQASRSMMKASPMLSEHVNSPAKLAPGSSGSSVVPGAPSKENLIGHEAEGSVPNIQGWKVPFQNAVKPVSDTLGSHADMDSSVSKDPNGPAQQLPSAISQHVDRASPQLVNEVEAVSKVNTVANMANIPSKAVGSLRHIATAGDKLLSVPFELASDVTGGLMKLLDEIADLQDMLMTQITKFVQSAVGGLVDGLVPTKLTGLITGPLSKFANQLGGLGQLLGGFKALSSIGSLLGGAISSLAAAIGDPMKLAAMLRAGANIAGIVGGNAAKNADCVNHLTKIKKLQDKLNKIAAAAELVGGALGFLQQGGLNGILGAIKGGSAAITNALSILKGGIGAISKITGALGNLGSMINGLGKGLSSAFASIRNPGQMLAGIMPLDLLNNMLSLDTLCGALNAAGGGFSVGKAMDALKDGAFDVAMGSFASHSSIIGPGFNKNIPNAESFAQEVIRDSFESSPFGINAQHSHGIGMYGPGATQFQKIFGAGTGVRPGMSPMEAVNAAAGGSTQPERWLDKDIMSTSSGARDDETVEEARARVDSIMAANSARIEATHQRNMAKINRAHATGNYNNLNLE